MAHMINDNEIAYRIEQPWHGLGVQVGDSFDMMNRPERVAAWLQAAKMDWTVQRRRIAMRDSNGVEMLTEPLSNYKAIVRKDTDRVFQIATDRYQIVQNAQIVEFFMEFCEAGHARLETIGAINGGDKVWALAKLEGDQGQFTVGKEDKAMGYMLLATSHDGSLQTVGKTTMVYVVCMNTLGAALGLTAGANGFSRMGKKESNEFRMRHVSVWDQKAKKRAQETMGIAIAQAQTVTDVANVLSMVKGLGQQGREEYVRRLLGVQNPQSAPTDSQALGNLMGALSNGDTPKVQAPEMELARLGNSLLDAMTSSPGAHLEERNDTLWGAVNGVTYFVDHERGRNQDSRLNGAWFGDGDRLKRSAVTVALEMAGVLA